MSRTYAPNNWVDPAVFLLSVETGDMEAVEHWMYAGVCPDTCNDFGRTGLHAATAFGHLAIVNRLLASGANPNAACEDGWTAICEAIKSRCPDILALLLAQGARVDLPKPWTAFETALRHKADVATFRILLNHLDWTTLGARGESLLELAIRAKHFDALQALLAAGVEVPVDANGECTLLYRDWSLLGETIFLTLLKHVGQQLSVPCLSTILMHQSSSQTPTRLLDALLEIGADPLHTGNSSVCALQRACIKADLPLITYFVESIHETLSSKVYTWLSDGALNAIEKIGPNFFSEQFKKGKIYLHFWEPDTRPVLQPFLKCINYFKKKVPLPASTDLLMISILADDISLCETMISLGAEINKSDQCHRLPLIEAIGRGWGYDFIDIFLKAGADINIQSIHGHTPLWTAIKVDEGIDRYEQIEIITMLLEHGANPQLTNFEDGMTPLLQAVKNNFDNYRLCEMLLNKGSNPNEADTVTGNTALMIAASKGNEEVFKLLLSRGGNPYITNLNGETAYYHAKYSENSCSIIKIIINNQKSLFKIQNKFEDTK